MQYFGTLETKYDEVFLTSSYLYFPKENETVTVTEIKAMIQTHKQRKNFIVGTVFFYNPYVAPVGYDSNKFLLDQEFDAYGEMVELQIENTLTVFKNAIKNCEGKLIEFKNLFNLNEKNINASTLLMKFNADLEKYNSNLNTEFERDIMYVDAQNYIPNGRFVFFAWGDKLNAKEFPYIFEYAKAIYDNSVKLGKKVAFAYKKERSLEFSVSLLQFSNPGENLKFKNSITASIKECFKKDTVEPISYE
ncbi:MAG: hypothetical protein WC141_03125 [Arcobacteraceae bacterium]